MSSASPHRLAERTTKITVISTVLGASTAIAPTRRTSGMATMSQIQPGTSTSSQPSIMLTTASRIRSPNAASAKDVASRRASSRLPSGSGLDTQTWFGGYGACPAGLSGGLRSAPAPRRCARLSGSPRASRPESARRSRPRARTCPRRRGPPRAPLRRARSGAAREDRPRTRLRTARCPGRRDAGRRSRARRRSRTSLLGKRPFDPLPLPAKELACLFGVHALTLPTPVIAQRSTSLDLYSLRCRLPHGTSSTRA